MTSYFKTETLPAIIFGVTAWIILTLVIWMISCASPNAMTHDQFIAKCHLKQILAGKLERKVCYAQGRPGDYGYVWMRADYCYECSDGIDRCYAEGDEP